MQSMVTCNTALDASLTVSQHRHLQQGFLGPRMQKGRPCRVFCLEVLYGLRHYCHFARQYPELASLSQEPQISKSEPKFKIK